MGATDIPDIPDVQFDREGYDQVRQTTLKGLDLLGDVLLPGLGDMISSIASIVLLPGWIIDAVVNALNALKDFLVDTLNFLIDLVEGALAPITFGIYSWTFQVDVFGKLTEAKGEVTGLPIAGTSDPLWQGAGATAYKGTVPKQSAAYDKIAQLSKSLGGVMMQLAVAGVSLYVAVASLILTLTGGLAAIGAEACSLLGIPAIPPTALTVTGVATALIAGITSLVTFIGTFAGKIAETASLAADNSTFPGGSWPKAVTPGSKGVMDDGTVTDGDADWSVPKR